MSDKEARVLGAGSSVTVGDKEYRLSPINMKTLMEIQREALRCYRNSYLSTFRDNLDCFPEAERMELLAKKVDEAARWDIGDIPKKEVFVVEDRHVNDAVKNLLQKELELEEVSDDDAWTSILSTALDQEKVTPAEIQRLTGSTPKKATVPYDMWWVTAAWEGMVTLLHAGVQQNHKITKDEVATWPMEVIYHGSRMVEKITSPDLGNT